MMLHFGLKLFVMVTKRAHDISTLPEAIQRRHNPDENRGMEELDDRGVGKFIISALWTFFRDISSSHRLSSGRFVCSGILKNFPFLPGLHL